MGQLFSKTPEESLNELRRSLAFIQHRHKNFHHSYIKYTDSREREDSIHNCLKNVRDESTIIFLSYLISNEHFGADVNTICDAVSASKHQHKFAFPWTQKNERLELSLRDHYKHLEISLRDNLPLEPALRDHLPLEILEQVLRRTAKSRSPVCISLGDYWDPPDGLARRVLKLVSLYKAKALTVSLQLSVVDDLCDFIEGNTSLRSFYITDCGGLPPGDRKRLLSSLCKNIDIIQCHMWNSYERYEEDFYLTYIVGIRNLYIVQFRERFDMGSVLDLEDFVGRLLMISAPELSIDVCGIIAEFLYDEKSIHEVFVDVDRWWHE